MSPEKSQQCGQSATHDGIISNSANRIAAHCMHFSCIAVALKHSIVGTGLIPGVMDYDEACFMHLTPGVVHNFPKAVGV